MFHTISINDEIVSDGQHTLKSDYITQLQLSSNDNRCYSTTNLTPFCQHIKMDSVTSTLPLFSLLQDCITLMICHHCK